MDYLNYLIYPIAGILAILALGGLNSGQRVVIAASLISLVLNGYAIVELVWWPIFASLASDFVLKKAFGDPEVEGATAIDEKKDALDFFLLGGFPTIMGHLSDPVARVGIQIFILGMVDMKRNVEKLSMAEFVSSYHSLLDRHDLALPVPTESFVEVVTEEARRSEDIRHLINEGAMAIRAYIANQEADAVVDLARAAVFAKENPGAISKIMDAF